VDRLQAALGSCQVRRSESPADTARHHLEAGRPALQQVRHVVVFVGDKAVRSFLRTLKTWHCPRLPLRAVLRPRVAAAPAVQQSIDISYLPGAQQQTRRTLLQRANGTDIVPFHRPCSACYAGNANNIRVGMASMAKTIVEDIAQLKILPHQLTGF